MNNLIYLRNFKISSIWVSFSSRRSDAASTSDWFFKSFRTFRSDCEFSMISMLYSELEMMFSSQNWIKYLLKCLSFAIKINWSVLRLEKMVNWSKYSWVILVDIEIESPLGVPSFLSEISICNNLSHSRFNSYLYKNMFALIKY